MSRGWWRRNWWALLAIPAALAAVVLVSPDDSYDRWREARGQEAVSPDPDGWVSFAGARLRLESVVPADLREHLTDEPFPLPSGLAPWLATITVELSHDEALLGCEMILEDAAGRQFGDAPSELSGARLGPEGPSHFGFSCRPTDDDDYLGGPFQAQGLYVLPASVQPAAVRILAFEERSYAWLPVD